MINSIHSHGTLNQFLSEHIKENGSEVVIHDSFYSEKTLIKDLIANISVDSFYNSLKQNPTPPSVDNLVVVKNRGENRFDIYIIELKDVRKMAGLDTKNIVAKFKTTVDDFMTAKFPEIFSMKKT